MYNRKWNGKGYDENENIIYELINDSGKVREYNCFGLEFEGEYLNGKKNGKGKKYNYECELVFEGEYLNRKRWNGKGKEDNNKDEVVFEGEYLNGKRWNGNEYNYYNNKLFEDELLNGIKISKSNIK